MSKGNIFSNMARICCEISKMLRNFKSLLRNILMSSILSFFLKYFMCIFFKDVAGYNCWINQGNITLSTCMLIVTVLWQEKINNWDHIHLQNTKGHEDFLLDFIEFNKHKIRFTKKIKWPYYLILCNCLSQTVLFFCHIHEEKKILWLVFYAEHEKIIWK